MSRYEERLQRDLTHLKEDLAKLAQAVGEAFDKAVRALLGADVEGAFEIILADHPINRASRELDRQCHRFIAVHLPSAGHLRLAAAVLRANIELERIGDYAVHICRETVQLKHPPEDAVAQQIGEIADQVRTMLELAQQAFIVGDAEAAKETMATAYEVRNKYDSIFTELVGGAENTSAKDMFAYLTVFKALTRVGDQAKNVCEEAVFAATGETKEAKVYRVLFLDHSNASLAPMAQAVARKNFPGSGQYDCASRQPDAALAAGLTDFLHERGFELGSEVPRALPGGYAELADYHVIVSLQGPLDDYMETVPFQSVGLAWDLGNAPETSAPEERVQYYESIYRQLAVRIEELMTTLRGEEAA